MPSVSSRLDLRVGDALDVLATIRSSSIDVAISDPPYGSATHAWGQHAGEHQAWAASGIAFSSDIWAEVRRVVKPGGYVAVFAHPRTSHRVAVALEDAGWELTTTLAWIKSHSTSPGNRDLGAELERRGADNELVDRWTGWRSHLRAAYEPILVARNLKKRKGNPALTILGGGSGGWHVDALRIPELPGEQRSRTPGQVSDRAAWGIAGRTERSTPHEAGRLPTDVLLECLPTCEPTLHAPGCAGAVIDGQQAPRHPHPSRFFSNTIRYSGRPEPAERAHGTHPTQKPRAVCDWLATGLVQPGATALDLFAGSGAITAAMLRAGAGRVVAIEREKSYAEMIRATVDDLRGRQPVQAVAHRDHIDHEVVSE